MLITPHNTSDNSGRDYCVQALRPLNRLIILLFKCGFEDVCMNTVAQTASLESDSKLMTVTKIKQMPSELSPSAL